MKQLNIKSLHIVWILLPVLFLGLGNNITSASASSGGEVSCYDRGVIDDEDHPFNQGTYDRCGEDYYQGFLQGCMSVDGNSRDTCGSATDG